MEYQDLVKQLTPELVATFRRALELGRWPDGRLLDASQREHCMQAVIAFEGLNVPEQQRVGYIDRGHKAGSQCDDESVGATDTQPLKWDHQNDNRHGGENE